MSNGDDARGRGAEKPTGVPAKGWMDITKRGMAEIKEDNIPVVAAGVAFYSWVALIPALIALITIYGLVASPQTVTEQINQMTESLSPDVAGILADTIRSATSASSRGLSIGLAISVATALWTASGGMDGLIKGINIAYDEPQASFPKRRGLAILLTLGAIIFLVLAVGLITVVPVVLDTVGLSPIVEIAVQVVRWLLLTALVMAGLAVLYRIAPNRDSPQFKWVSVGAVVATILWLLGSAAFSLYVNNFGSYNKTYGALAGVIVLNLWLFLSSFVVLLGAEINSEAEAQTRKDTTVGEERPMGQRRAKKADELGEAAR